MKILIMVIFILLTLPLVVAEDEFSSLLINKEGNMSIEVYSRLLDGSDSLFTKSLLNIFLILSKVDGMIVTDTEIENMVVNSLIIQED